MTAHAESAVDVLFVQHANPAVYPPTEHAALMLARSGARVHLLGIALLADVRFVEQPGVSVALLPAPMGGWRLKLHFVRFVWWVCLEAWRRRPAWIYACDPLSTPAAWLACRLTGARAVYHEHDAPPTDPRGATARYVAFCRRRFARSASLCVAPATGRADLLQQATGCGPVTVVWNTPGHAEVAPARLSTAAGLRLLYHGSIVPARVPDTLFRALAALPEDVTLCVTGYDPSGGEYVGRLRRLAADLALETRVEFREAVDRRALMRQCATFDVGLALLPLQSASFNEQTMLGASNKVFDYLAGGLAVIVPDLDDWRATFVSPGYGVACDPASVDGLQAAIRRLYDDPDSRREMGERGRQRILVEWHYEEGFRPVVEAMRGRPAADWRACA